jgi:hypothetical protein
MSERPEIFKARKEARKEGHNTNFRIHEFSPGKFDVPGNSEIGIVSPISLSIQTRCRPPSINN